MLKTSSPEFPSMPDILPEGASGNAAIKHFEISEADAKAWNLRVDMHPRRYHHAYDRLKPGRYATLEIDGDAMMSDTPMERLTNMDVVERATGHVLIAGLGLGMILHPILGKPDVQHVMVLELSRSVITLVGPSLLEYGRAGRLTLTEADVFDWKPMRGTRFDTIYFDIWPATSKAFAGEITLLKRRFRPYLKKGGWMGAWREYSMRQPWQAMF